MDDGGPAFPYDAHQVGYGSHGMSLRSYYIAHAPASEIEAIAPADIKGCAEFLGINVDEYNGPDKWPRVLAKARGMWADAMLAARRKDGKA